MQNFLTKLQVGVLAICSLFTSITVLLIVIFLFKEGISFFGKKPVEEGFVLAVNNANGLNAISPADCKKIFDQEITDWKGLNGVAGPITMITLEDIGSTYTEEQIGADMEYLDTCYNNYIQNNAGVLAVIPERNYTSKIIAKKIDIEKNSLSAFIKEKEWFPTSKPIAQFGAFPLLIGTLMVALGAIINYVDS
jgi:phosphate transport system permease protein